MSARLPHDAHKSPSAVAGLVAFGLLTSLVACSSGAKTSGGPTAHETSPSSTSASTSAPSSATHAASTDACALLTRSGAQTVLHAPGATLAQLPDATATHCAYKQGTQSVTLVVGDLPGSDPKTMADESAAEENGAKAVALKGTTCYFVTLSPSRELIYGSTAGQVFFLDGEFASTDNDFDAATGSPTLNALAKQISQGA